MSLTLKLLAESITGIADGSAITTWPDASGGGNTFSPGAGAAAPVYKANSLAGRPGVLFDGVDDYCERTGGGNTLAHYITAGAHAGIAVYKPRLLTTSYANSYLNHAIVSDVGGGYWGFILKATPSALAALWDGADKTVAHAIDANAVTVSHWYHSGGTLYHAVNGGAYTSAAAGNISDLTHTLVLGKSYDSLSFLNFDLGELWLYDALPTDFATTISSLLVKYKVNQLLGTEEARDRATREIRLYRRPAIYLGATPPVVRALGIDVGDRVVASHAAIPFAGAGLTERFLGTVIRKGYNPDAGKIGIEARGVRDYLSSVLWVPYVTTSGAQAQQGVQRMLGGSTWTFTRASSAWIEDPSDGHVVEVSSDQEKIDRSGALIERYSANLLLNSSAALGTTSWTGTGTGTFTTDTTVTLFDASISPQTFKLVAPNPVGAGEIMDQTSIDLSGYSTDKFFLSIDHVDDSGQPLTVTVQRSSDSKWFRASDSTWQAAETANALTVRSTMYRDVLPVMDIGTGSPCTIKVRLKAITANAQVNHIGHVQLEEKRWATSRIVTRSALLARQADQLLISNNSAARSWPNSHGTLLMEFVPQWSSSLVSGEFYTLAYAYYDANNWWELYWHGTNGKLTLACRAAGTTVEASSAAATLTRGTVAKFAARWIGSDGELDLAPYTLHCFVNGAAGKGSATVAAALPTQVATADLEIGKSGQGAEGAIRRFRLTPVVLTDAEIERWD